MNIISIVSIVEIIVLILVFIWIYILYKKEKRHSLRIARMILIILSIIIVITHILLSNKNIKVSSDYLIEKETKIDVNIIVEYGVRIPDVAFEIQNKVKKAVESMTGLKVVEVNVHIQGVSTENMGVENDKEEDKE